MIKKLHQNNIAVAKEIYGVFQISYKIEAEILQVEPQEFPPLKRKENNFQSSESEFYGFYSASILAAVVEINQINNITDICSLVVHPLYFRQGIAKNLLKFAVELYASELIIVETGLLNKPAIALYENFGFELQRKYLTAIGVEKVQFSLKK